MLTEHVRDVAVFIDFENVYVSVREKLDESPNFELIMDRCNDLGRVVIARAYADWYRYPRITSALYANGIEPIYVPTYYYDKDMGRTGRAIKNSVDMNLCVDAMKALFANDNIARFVLITGDRDFIPLVNSIRQQGKEVIVIGIGGAASTHLAQSADEFVFYEQIVGKSATPAQKPKTTRSGTASSDTAPAKAAPASEPDIYDTLIEAVHLVRERGYLSTLGSLKLVMKELMGGDFKESRYKDQNGRPFSKFKDFVVEAERRGKVQIYTSGTVSEVFLPGEDASKLSQFADLKEETASSPGDTESPVQSNGTGKETTKNATSSSSGSNRSRRRRRPRNQQRQEPEQQPKPETPSPAAEAQQREREATPTVQPAVKTQPLAPSMTDQPAAEADEKPAEPPEQPASAASSDETPSPATEEQLAAAEQFPMLSHEQESDFLFNVGEALTLSNLYDTLFEADERTLFDIYETLEQETAEERQASSPEPTREAPSSAEEREEPEPAEYTPPVEAEHLTGSESSTGEMPDAASLEVVADDHARETPAVSAEEVPDTAEITEKLVATDAAASSKATEKTSDTSDTTEDSEDSDDSDGEIVFTDDEWQVFRTMMQNFLKPTSFGQIFDSLRELRNQQVLTRTNEQLRSLIKQAINNGVLERSGRGKRVYYMLKQDDNTSNEA